jgi:hypothetical protein
MAKMNDPSLTEQARLEANRPPNAGVIAALILGSPEFQKR